MKAAMWVAGAALALGSVAYAGSISNGNTSYCAKFKEANAAKSTFNVAIGGVDCTLKRPAKQTCTTEFVFPSGARGAPFEQRSFCYKAKCPKSEAQVSGNDSFGSHNGAAKQTSLVCLTDVPN